MSGFDASWLALREPADHAARNAGLARDLAAYIGQRANPIALLDVGCGTGSTWRSLSPLLPPEATWLLLDNDPLLLAEAQRQIGATDRVRFRRHDLNDLAGLPLDEIAVVTASALFDLCSQAFCVRFVDHIAEKGCGLYAALNYDGAMRWSVTHPLDEAVVAAFNRHQRTDKGFGPALGPDATDCLARHLERHGYRVSLGASPWRMGPQDDALQRAFLDGFRQPLREIGTLSDAEIKAWLAFRLQAIDRPDRLCEVGHTDLLALPS